MKPRRKPKIETDYRKLGRKTKLNKTLLRAIKLKMRKAIFEKYVYGAVGIPKATWYYWKQKAGTIREDIEKGAKPKSDYQKKEWAIFLDFLATTETTRPKVIADLIYQGQQSAKTNPQMLRFMLQTLAKDEFGEADTLNLKHSGLETLIGRMREAHAEYKKEMEEKE